METYITICKIASRNWLCDTETSSQCSVTTRGVEWGRRWKGGFRREGTYVYL